MHQNFNKLAAMIAIATGLTGCGLAQNLNESCGGSLDGACKALFGEEIREPAPDDDSALEGRIESLEGLLESLTAYAESLGSEQEIMQGQIEQVQADLAELETDQTVVEIIDPCGDFPGRLDEVILKLSDGSLIAYFEYDNNKKFLTVLGPDNYVTTDHQRCSFSVTAEGEVLD